MSATAPRLLLLSLAVTVALSACGKGDTPATAAAPAATPPAFSLDEAKLPAVNRFQLADHVRVIGAGLENGLLTIDLKREIPEEMKPRRIEIDRAASTPKVAQRKIDVEKRAA